MFATIQESSVWLSRTAASAVSHGASRFTVVAKDSNSSRSRPTSIADSNGKPKVSSE